MTFLSEVSEVPMKPQKTKQNDITYDKAYKSLNLLVIKLSKYLVLHVFNEEVYASFELHTSFCLPQHRSRVILYGLACR